MTQTEQHSMPKLRFPEFSDSWVRRRCDYFLQRISIPIEVQPNLQYREIGIRSHGRGVFHKEPTKGKDLGDKRVFQAIPNTLCFNIVFAWEQALAILSEDEEGFIASHRFPMYSSFQDRAHLGFFKYFFLRPKGKHLLALASPGGAGRNKTLGQRNFAELKIIAPAFSEQRKIAGFVREVDEKVEQLKAKKCLLESYKKACMQQLFSGNIRFKDDNGRDFSDWAGKRLGSMGRFTGGGTPDTNVDEYWGGEIAWVSSSDLTEGSIHNLRIKRRITQDAVKASATQITPKGAILIVTRVGIGKCAIAPEDVCTSQDFTNFVPEEGINEFIAYWLSHNKGKLKSLAQGTSIKGITTHDLKALKISLPSPAEQRKIADFLLAVDAKIDLVCREIECARSFRNGLLQQMFV